MTLKARTFHPEQWSQGLWPVTALLGSEAFFITRISDSWRQFGKTFGYSGRSIVNQEDSDSSTRLLNELETLSLFADKTLVELRLTSSTLNSDLRKSIQKWIDYPSDSKSLLIYGGTLAKSETLSEWHCHLNKVGRVIDASTVPTNEFPKWLDREIKQASIEIDFHGKHAIVMHTKGNMLAAYQVIQRLKLVETDSMAGSSFTLEQVMETLTHSAKYTIYDLVDLALKGDIPNVNRVCDLLITEGLEIFSMLWAIHREIDILLQIRYRLNQGETIEKILNSLNIWRNRKNLVYEAVDRLDLTQLRKLQSLCHKTDRIIKGHSKEPASFLIKDLLFGLSGFHLQR